MRIKGHDHGISTGLARTLQGTPYHCLMTNVEPIEDANREVC
jgi:hypothetical protein